MRTGCGPPPGAEPGAAAQPAALRALSSGPHGAACLLALQLATVLSRFSHNVTEKQTSLSSLSSELVKNRDQVHEDRRSVGFTFLMGRGWARGCAGLGAGLARSGGLLGISLLSLLHGKWGAEG